MISLRVGRHQGLKLLVLGGLVLLLQIPVVMIAGLVHDRQATRATAASDIHRTWGREQRVVGPILRVPYLHRWVEEDRDGTRRNRESTRYAYFLPESLHVSGSVVNETLRRGIFDVSVYEARLQLAGRFGQPTVRDLGIDADVIQWDRAELSLRVSDPRAIAEGVQLRWGDRSLAFLPGAGAQDSHGGIHAPLGVPSPSDFSLDVVLRGSDSLLFSPAGKDTRVQLTSDWPSPSFVGSWLPVERSVDRDGFEALWRVSYLGRGFPQAWRDDPASGPNDGSVDEAIGSATFGLRFLATVDPYRMASRSTKYAILFIGLTFTVFWLFEILAGLPSHPVQYLLIGGALCLFYLLELALSEHVGFGVAYAIATIAVAGVVTAYAVAVLRETARAALVGGLLVGLYGYLYLLLRMEDYALLLGSVGLFGALASIMYLTRGIDWYGRAGAGATAVDGELS